MKCIISGMETNNKWKGKPVSKEVLEMAQDRINSIGCTVREALIHLQKEFRKEAKLAAEEKEIIMKGKN